MKLTISNVGVTVFVTGLDRVSIFSNTHLWVICDDFLGAVYMWHSWLMKKWAINHTHAFSWCILIMVRKCVDGIFCKKHTHHGKKMCVLNGKVWTAPCTGKPSVYPTPLFRPTLPALMATLGINAYCLQRCSPHHCWQTSHRPQPYC